MTMFLLKELLIPDQNDFKNAPVHYVKVLDIIFIIMLKSTLIRFLNVL